MTVKILAILIVILTCSYKLVLSVIKHRSANNPTPKCVSDIYDEETYAKWKKYSAEHCLLDIVADAISCVFTVLMLIFNAHASFASLFPSGVFMQMFGVVLYECLVSIIVSTAISYIGTMVIEEKYGFNRSTGKTFTIDKIREFIIGFILDLMLVLGLWGVHTALDDWLILLFAISVFAFSIGVSFLYPILSRIGNKFTPLEDGELKDRLMELLTKHGYRVKAIEIMDASRRTTKSNAYFTGFGKMKTVVLYDNLVNNMTTDEICAVFAHELGHGLHRDVLKLQIINFGNLLLMSLVVWIAVKFPILHTSFGFDGVNYGFAFVLLSIGLGLTHPLTGIGMNAVSRHAEFRADRQAISEGYGEALISALKKLSRDNFAHLSPSRINVVLEYSHPPISERIEAIEREMSK